jgi:Zn-dependent protease
VVAPAHPRARHDRVASGIRPPRWTFPLFGPRLRVSAGLAALSAVAVGVAAWGPGGLVSWLPLVALVSVALSTLVHEGAHAAAAHHLGYRVEWVVLGGLAGVTAYFGRHDRPLERAAVALAGPAASAALVLGLLAARGTMSTGGTATALVEMAIAANVVALVANLLPFGHTDGAHLLDGLAEHASRPGRRA